MTLTVIHDQTAHKFYITLDGYEGFLKYKPSDNGTVLNYDHTFVPKELRGKNIASSLAEFALEYAREKNIKVIPTCSFVSWYIEQHPEYKSLVV